MTKPDAINPLDDRFIDQIVDGALTPAELRAAIERLDRQPDGWRRCAMAFLEAQCFSESCRSLEPAGSSLSARQAPALAAGGRSGAGYRWIRAPIAAAIIAASFALGWAGHAARPWSGAEGTQIARASANPRTPLNGSRSELYVRDDVDLPEPPRRAAGTPVEKQTLPTVKEVIRAVARLHIGSKTAGADVPILAGPGITEQWLRSQPPPVTEYSQAALKRQGFQVDQSRQFITTTLADGRRVTIPIDQVQIRYTGNQPL